jgi:hypothetical protein
MRRIAQIAALIFFLCASGCASWDVPDNSPEWHLPTPKVGNNSVVVETAFIRWPVPLGEGDPLWETVDEQFLPPSRRQRLAANGLRIGVLSNPLPEPIRLALDATKDPLTVISDRHATPGAEVLTRRERRNCPSGSVEEIEVLPIVAGRRVLLVQDEGRVRAIPFDQPRGVFRYSLEADGGGRVRVDLRPVIDFGEPKQRVIGGQNAYRFDIRRDQELFDDLAVSAHLVPGQTLVITASPDPKGLGAMFFTSRFEPGDDRLLLLLRIADAQHDELFSPQRDQEALVTPLK